MKNLSVNEMENVSGGSLSAEERKHFLGVAGCVLTLTGGWAGAIFGGAACIDYILG